MSRSGRLLLLLSGGALFPALAVITTDAEDAITTDGLEDITLG